MNSYESIYDSGSNFIIPFSLYIQKESLLYKNPALAIKINQLLVDGKEITGIPVSIDFDYFDMSTERIRADVTFTYPFGDFLEEKTCWKLVFTSELRDNDALFIQYSIPKDFSNIKFVYQVRFANASLSEQNTLLYRRPLIKRGTNR